MKKLFLLCAVMLMLSGCSGETNTETGIVNEESETNTSNEVNDTYDSTNSSDNYDTYDSNSDSPYTKEELESDPIAPSTNPNDYNSDGEFVPENSVSDNPADYNSNGESRPIEDMTQEEIQAELEQMLGESLGQ